MPSWIVAFQAPSSQTPSISVRYRDAAVATLSARIDGVDRRMEGLATKEYVLRTLLSALAPPYIGILGLYFAG